MCAIFGWWKPEFPSKVKKDKLLRALARKSQAYGNKAFGLAAIAKGKLKTARYTGPASQWLQQNEKEVADWAAAEKLLGHTRLPTHGAVTKANTHPFEIGEWQAAHNGCISNSDELMVKAVHDAKGETDSEEALCYVVGKDFDPEALAEIEGSYAFEAMRSDGSELVLVCDRVRDVYVVRAGDGLVWCTSRNALTSALTGAGYGVADVLKMSGEVFRLKDGEDMVVTKLKAEPAKVGFKFDMSVPSWVGEHEPATAEEMID